MDAVVTGRCPPENQDRVLALSGEVEGKKRGFSCWRTVWAVWSMVRRSVHNITDEFLKWWEEDFPQMAHAGKCEEEIRELLEQEIWDINQVLAFRKRENCRSGSTISILLYTG